MTPAQRWEKRQRIFDKVEQSFNAGKANNSFWDYVSKELGKIETSPEEWRQALKRCVERHPRTRPVFENRVSDAEVARIMKEAN